MKQITINIPPELSFESLDFQQEANGEISYDSGPLEQLCEMNGLDSELILQHEENRARLISDWYQVHRHNNGNKNAYVEALLEKSRFENKQGGFSYSTGNA